MPSSMRSGTTIIELTVVLAVVTILIAIIIPRSASMLDRARVSSATSEAIAVFGAARQVAIRRGRRATVLIDTAGASMLVLVGADTAHRRTLGRVHGVRLEATRDSISFHPTGMGYGGANLTLRITRGRAADTVFVSRLGRVRH